MDNLIKNLQDTSQINQNLATYLPNLPASMPQESFDYQPPAPFRRRRIPILPPQLLSRRIYLEMQRATRDYADLETIAPQQDKQTISSLKSQMQILALTMLRIYNELSGRRNIPFFASNNMSLPNNYLRALQEMYSRVFHIHELTLRLFNRVGSAQISQTILIVLLNLKSQLNTLNNLIEKQTNSLQR